MAGAERLGLSPTLLESGMLPLHQAPIKLILGITLRPAVELPRQSHLEFLIFIYRLKKKL